MRNIKFWLICALAFIFWKSVFSTSAAKEIIKDIITSQNNSDSVQSLSVKDKSLSDTQIKQIEGIAQNIAMQSNANKQNILDEMTESFNAIAVGRNVRFEYVMRLEKGVSSKTKDAWLDALRAEIIPNTCVQNLNNLAFDRGLSYTFSYKNPSGDKLGDVFVDKTICKTVGR